MKLLYTSLACAALASAQGQSPISNDLFDVTSGVVITGFSAFSPFGGGGPAAILGENGQDLYDDWSWGYFADGAAPNFVHYLEWETPADVTIGGVRVFGFGENFNNLGREFDQFILKAKSPGSETYDITVLTYAPPPTFFFVDWETGLLMDELVTPVTARSFRAEFITEGAYGPHIMEIDGLPAAPPPPPPGYEGGTTFSDVWDFSQGAMVTATSGVNLAAGSLAGMFGENGQMNGFGSTWTYFNDGQPEGFVHSIEWETPGEATISGVRVFAFGDANLNNGREFAEMTIKAKSPGSSSYDLTLLTFAPTHPYTFLDPLNAMILDQTITSVTSRFFRAEFVQYNAGFGSDGPRIVEIDAIGTMAPPPPPPDPVLPMIAAQPEAVTANLYAPAALWVDATGTGTLHYQWFKNGAALGGQTSPALQIASLTAADVGNYCVSVTDDVGTVTSAEAAVSLDLVNMLPSDFDLWDVRIGSTVGAHSAIADGSDLVGMFGGDVTQFADGAGSVQFVEWSAPSAAVVRTVRLFARGDGLNFANHEFGSFTLKAKSPGSATFDIVVGTFTPAHPYPLLDGNTSAVLDADITPITASEFRAEFTSFNGAPRVLELDAFGTRPIVKPGILIAPQSQSVQRNANAILSVVAKGGNLQFQWKLNGQPIAGATGASLTVLKMNKRDEGNYSVVVSNELGSVESAAAVLTIPTKH